MRAKGRAAALGLDCGGVFLAPLSHMTQNRYYVMTFVCEVVLAAIWCAGARLFFDNTVLFELIESLAERAWVDAFDRALQFTKTFWLGVEVAKYKRSPFLANDVGGR